MMIYKGYIGNIVEINEEAEVIHGEVINIKDTVTFQGKSIHELKIAFHESVDDYLAFCTSRGEEPERPFSGKLNLRLRPELHREVYIQAKVSGISINDWINNAIQEYAAHH